MTHDVVDGTTDARSLAASLEPVLAEACEGRLSRITWFRTDWQRGGAATGTATLSGPDSQRAEVVVKLPVVDRELLWISRLQGDQPVVPRLYAGGRELAGYDLAWVVIERFEHGPLGIAWHDDHPARIADAAARFYAAASAYPVDQPAVVEPWESLLKESLESTRRNALPRRREWLAAIKSLRRRLGRVLERWDARDTAQWLHGDLHLANAMSRVAMDSGPVCLIDLGEVHPGHWIEDAIYLERQLWARPERLKATNPVKAMAAARKAHGLAVEDDYARLAMIRRALLAATAPRYIKSEGHPAHLEACLDWLRRAAGELQ